MKNVVSATVYSLRITGLARFRPAKSVGIADGGDYLVASQQAHRQERLCRMSQLGCARNVLPGCKPVVSAPQLDRTTPAIVESVNVDSRIFQRGCGPSQLPLEHASVWVGLLNRHSHFYSVKPLQCDQ